MPLFWCGRSVPQPLDLPGYSLRVGVPTTRSPELSSCAVSENRKDVRLSSSSAVDIGGPGTPGGAAEVGGLARAGGDGDVRAGGGAVGGVAGEAFHRAVVAVVGAAGGAAGRRIAGLAPAHLPVPAH